MKKLSCIFATLILCVLCSAIISLPTEVAFGNKEEKAVSSSATYFYNQLNEKSKKMYQAIDSLYTSGEMQSGVGTLDLVAKGFVTDEEVSEYISGVPTLALSFQDARDAFIKDKCEVFYVDFTKLTLRIGKIGDVYASILGSGVNENYYADGFASKEEVVKAIDSVSQHINTVVSGVKAQINKETVEQKGSEADTTVSASRVVELVHNLLVGCLQYTYPDETHKYVTGIYSIVDSYANCVGYSTLLKVILAKFNIDSVLVEGDAINSREATERHMWNYVKIYDLWFAVDTTWDDPITQLRSAETKSQYLLKGSNDFSIDHFPLNVFSPNGVTFSYPELFEMSYEYYTTMRREDASTSLKIYTDKFTDKEGIQHTGIKFGYWDSATSRYVSMKELRSQGLYLAARFAYGTAAFQPWVPVDIYIDSKDENLPYQQWVISKEGSIQFCVTKIPTSLNQFIYKEDLSLEGNNVSITTPFRLPYWDKYVAPPFIRKSFPSLGKCILPEKTSYVVEFDEELALIDETLPVTIKASSTENLPSEVSNISISYSQFNLPDGTVRKSTIVKFDFDPDKSYQSYINKYSLQLENVKGATSDKAPNPVPINVTFKMIVPCPTYVGKGSANAFVIGLPTLVVNDKLDIFEYDGKSSAVNPLDIRLVASIPDETKTEEMLKASGESEILSSAVYDLSLACRDYVAKLKSDSNYNVTIGLPYPKGFNYNDNKNVQFKAYHYRKQADGSFVAEEIVCRITDKGLEVLVNDFSPFAIVAVPKTGEEALYKFVGVEAMTAGGDVLTEVKPVGTNSPVRSISAVGIHTMEKNETKIFTVVANEGYVIDKVLLNGNAIQVVNGKVELRYEASTADAKLQAYFIHKSVRESETINGFEGVEPLQSWTNNKWNIVEAGIKFISKTFTYNINNPNNVFEMLLTNLPNGYNVVYSGNKASAVGSYVANATIYKLKADGTLDEDYNPLVLTANYSVIIEQGTANPASLLLVIIIVAIVLIGALVAIVLVIKRDKRFV